ncbi:MerR family transcriptional regulator [Fusibacter sp. JL216-2]|uniref:MerR family transcriptional regulator n=1 Tax=Fusibacter sp. JL216-2 TaxID=3071453 RepID=UPI003D34A78F
MFSKLKNCSKCGRVFQAEEIGQKYCARCSSDEDDMFMQAREYIYDNPDTNVVEVSEELEIDEDLILKWLRQGRLELKGEGVGYPCDRCGKSIKSGRFCDACQNELKNGFNDAFGVGKEDTPSQNERPKSSHGMHVKKRR